MEKALEKELSEATKKALAPTDLLERLLSIEASGLIERRMERRVRESRLPEKKLLADFDFAFQTGVDKAQIMEIAKLDFVERKQGLVLAGNSGTGKSHIAKALLLLACGRLYRCRYATAAGMLADLMASRADNTLPTKLRDYISPDVLLIDEVGFDRLEQEDARNASLFFKVIDGRYCKGSTLITTNIDFRELGDYLGIPSSRLPLSTAWCITRSSLTSRGRAGGCTNRRSSTPKRTNPNRNSFNLSPKKKTTIAATARNRVGPQTDAQHPL